ncbi:hypothetical protein [Atopobium sp. oral taxon 416]|uniref:hypothetical protein n=1 Tax=Atopobium sp. oral taxon 416 TaxID=712157 RepID=UPI001BAA6C2D|nr:hypothetical protein [Atopobium sp. oral taxon 416]QUC04286.1 hypothetical protein J4859_04945 [Atopobium sp. oral taxon 416]
MPYRENPCGAMVEGLSAAQFAELTSHSTRQPMPESPLPDAPGATTSTTATIRPPP